MKLLHNNSVLILLIFLSTGFFNSILAQNEPTAAQWQEDLRFLQETVHKDYPFLFKKVTAADFDAAVEKLYKGIPTLEPQEMPVAISRIVSLFQYGHTKISFFTLANDHILPINVRPFTDGLYIEGGHKKYANAIGGKVVAVEGIPIDTALQMIRPVVPVENNSYFNAYGMRYLMIPSVLQAQKIIEDFKTDITLTIAKEGKTFDQTFTAVPRSETSIAYRLTVPNETWISARDQNTTPLYLKYLNDKLFYFEYLEEEKTIYARQSRVRNETDETLIQFYDRLFAFIETNDVEKLIYDVRLNGGGNNFLNTPLITGVIETKKINQKGKFFVITGNQTFSAAQSMVNRLSNYTNAIFVGEPTAENVNFYGDANEVVLPNSQLIAYLSVAWWQDNAPWDNEDALHPDIVVAPSFEQYRTNDDPVLTAIMNFDPSTIILDPMDHLTELFMNNELEKFETTLTNWLMYGNYAAVNFKGQMNSIGNMLYNRGELDDAYFLLELNTRLYADAPEVWNSLGKVMIKKGNIDEAKVYLQKAIDLDPDGEVGNQAREYLKKI